MDLKALIRDVPDFPQPGIVFKDLTPLMADPRALAAVTDQLAQRYRDRHLDRIVGIDARGFIFGAPLAVALGVGFVPARKPGKLPWTTVEESYTLEYGTNTIAMHKDAVAPGQSVLIVDDLIATGGTLAATASLVRKLGGEVAEIAAIVELTFLGGRKLLGDTPVHVLIQY
jgi:adenine phosphoribosyltransferase